MTDTPTSENIKGYTPVTDAKRTADNLNKKLEEIVLRRIETLGANLDYELHELNIALQKIQEGFMWMNRAVFKPARIDVPEAENILEGLGNDG